MTFPLHLLNIIGKFQLLCGGVFEKIQKNFIFDKLDGFDLPVIYIRKLTRKPYISHKKEV